MDGDTTATQIGSGVERQRRGLESASISSDSTMDATWDRHDSEHEDFASSRELQEQALEIHRRMFGEEHPDTLTAKDGLVG